MATTKNKITPQALETPPLVQLKAPALPTETAALQSDLEVMTDAFTQQQTAQRENAQKQAESGLQAYLSAIQTADTPSSIQGAEYQKAGVDTLQAQSDEFAQKMLTEQQSLRRSIERIQGKGGGLASGAMGEIGNLERVSLAKQADLAVLQMGVQGRLDSARAIADRAVNARMEKQDKEQEALKLSFQMSKEIFDKTEQREFETLLGNRERALQEKRDRLKQIQDLSIQALADGAPPALVSQMQQSKTIDEAIRIGGGYIGLLDRQAKQANIAQSYASISASRTSQLLALAKAGDPNAVTQLGFDPNLVEQQLKNKQLSATELRQTNDRVRANEELVGLIGEYKNMIDTVGFEGSTWGGANLGKFDTLRARITAVTKKAETLGTLDAGVLQLVDQLIGQRPEKGGFTQNVLGFQSRRVSSGLEKLIDITNHNLAKDKVMLGDVSSVIGDDDLEEINSLY